MPKLKGKQIADGTVTATQVDETGTLSTINAGDAAVTGTATGLVRRDHQHAVATGAATNAIAVGDGAAEGSSSNLAREDHVHALAAPAAPANITKSAASAGVATTVARADHKHDVTTAAPVEITDTTNANGSSTSLVRADHQHAHGSRGGGTLHSAATTSVAGFMSATDKTKLDLLVDPKFVDAKESVRALEASSNIDANGTPVTVDGVTVSTGDRVALFGQSTTTEDGIYIVGSGAWARASDFPAGSSQAGAVFAVEEGTANGDELWMVTNNDGSDVVGTDDLVAVQVSANSPRTAGDGLVLNGNDLDVGANGDGSIVVNTDDIQVGVINATQHGTLAGGTTHADAIASGASGFMSGTDKSKLNNIEANADFTGVPYEDSITAQNISGSDTAITDTLTATPVSGTLHLYLNGLQQEQGAGKDYTVSGATITWLAASGTAVALEDSDVLIAQYFTQD